MTLSWFPLFLLYYFVLNFNRLELGCVFTRDVLHWCTWTHWRWNYASFPISFLEGVKIVVDSHRAFKIWWIELRNWITVWDTRHTIRKRNHIPHVLVKKPVCLFCSIHRSHQWHICNLSGSFALRNQGRNHNFFSRKDWSDICRNPNIISSLLSTKPKTNFFHSSSKYLPSPTHQSARYTVISSHVSRNQMPDDWYSNL